MCCMLEGIQAITYYKTTLFVCVKNLCSWLPQNDFYVRCEAQNNMLAGKTTPIPTDQVLFVCLQ